MLERSEKLEGEIKAGHIRGAVMQAADDISESNLEFPGETVAGLLISAAADALVNKGRIIRDTVTVESTVNHRGIGTLFDIVTDELAGGLKEKIRRGPEDVVIIGLMPQPDGDLTEAVRQGKTKEALKLALTQSRQHLNHTASDVGHHIAGYRNGELGDMAGKAITGAVGLAVAALVESPRLIVSSTVNAAKNGREIRRMTDSSKTIDGRDY